ncbi:MAG: hypothetical protein GQ574_00980 [Crocinitomix sp.]|nr:hypothetical protein [Crocinitomix sp.]
MKEALKTNWKFFAIASLTLGLAPFTPPHIWGKLQWIMGGAEGMQAMDWFDFLMHGAPWFLLIISGVLNLLDRKPKTA